MPLIRLVKKGSSIDKFIFYEKLGSDLIHNEVIKFNTNLVMQENFFDIFLKGLIHSADEYNKITVSQDRTLYHGECLSSFVSNIKIANPFYTFSEIGIDLNKKKKSKDRKKKSQTSFLI